MHIFGMPLFMDYYTLHDMDQGTIGFVPHSVSSKGQLIAGSKPTQFFTSKSATEDFGNLEAVYNIWTQLICAGILVSALLIYRYCVYDPLIYAGFDLVWEAVISVIYFLFFVCICSFVIVPFIGPIVSGQTTNTKLNV